MRALPLVLCASLALSLTACGPSPEEIEAKAHTAAKAAVERTIVERLKDPDSAKFARERVVRKPWNGTTALIVCGTVNAKNAFGGYTGAQRFVARVEEFSDSRFVRVAFEPRDGSAPTGPDDFYYLVKDCPPDI